MLWSEKEQKVRECVASGKPIREWCKEEGIPYSTYTDWVRKFSQKDASTANKTNEPSVQWIPVQTEKVGNTQTKEDKQGSPIELHCGKWGITIANDCKQDLLKSVLSLVNELC